MEYLHGIKVEEVPTSLPLPASGSAGLQVVFGTAPINLAANPNETTNKLFLINSMDEAVEKLGYCEDYENYTLCQSMYASFELFGVGPVIFCNVLDPKKHVTSEAEKEYIVKNRQVKVDVFGMLVDDLRVLINSQELSKDVDYIVTFDKKGYLIISLLATEKTNSAERVKVSGKKLNPSAVTERDIIGGYDNATGVESGIELLRQVFPRFGVVPALVLAPGYSKNVNVSAVLETKMKNINGKFKSMAVIDIDTASTTKYTDVIGVRERVGYSSEDTVILWPMVKTVTGKVVSYSAIWAAVAAKTDLLNGDVPNLSPSNKVLEIGAACLADGTEVILDEPQANILNAKGIVTIINQKGFRTWGNNTAAYPANSDPKDRWIAVKRFFGWFGNTFILEFMDKVDNPIDYRLIESVVDKENIRGNSLSAQGKCAGIRVEYLKSENTIEKILEGKIKFKTYLAPFTPAESIINELEFDPRMIKKALGE